MCQACPRDRTMASFFKYVYAYWNARFMDPAVQDLYVLLTDVPVTKEQLPTNDDRVSKMAALVRGDKIHALELHFGVPGKTLYDASQGAVFHKGISEGRQGASDTVIDEFRTWWQLEPVNQSAGATSSDMPLTMLPHINAPGAYRVGGDVKSPVIIHRVDPIYPEAARRDHITGIAIAEVLIGKDGRVKDAIVLKGLPGGLSEAMLDAIRQWEFKPGTKNGEPVDVIFNLTTNFKLDSTPHPSAK